MPLPEPLTPRKNPRQSRAQATVAAILEAAAHILVQRGYQGMTTNHVAERAGVSIGSLYQYFPGKDSLVAALLQKNADDNLAVLEEAIDAASGKPLAEAIDRIVGAFVVLHAGDPDLHAALIDGAPFIGAMAWEREMNERTHRLARDFLLDYRRDLRPGLDLTLALKVMQNIFVSVVDHALTEDPGKLDCAEFKSEIVSAILAYLTGVRPDPACG